jgi:antitoxin HicB
MSRGENIDIQEILKRPYHWITVREDDGSFFAIVLEFPGCYATGRSRQSAMSNLWLTAQNWLEAVVDQGQSIPEPVAPIWESHPYQQTPGA